jgi:hypothetical protein
MTAKIIYALAAAVMIFFTAWLGWRSYHNQERGCAQSIAWCKPADVEKAKADCSAILDDIGQRLGRSNERLAAQCMIDSMSCNESLSCLAHADRRAKALK